MRLLRETGHQGPLKKATKFTEQLSGQVNANVMAREKESMSGGDLGSGVDDWPGVKTTSGAGTASNAGAEFGMGRPWAPDDIDTDNKLTNDVPAELSIDEQVGPLVTGCQYLQTSLDIVMLWERGIGGS